MKHYDTFSFFQKKKKRVANAVNSMLSFNCLIFNSYEVRKSLEETARFSSSLAAIADG